MTRIKPICNVPERPVDMDPLVDPLHPDYDRDTWDPMWLAFNDDTGVTMALHLNWADAILPGYREWGPFPLVGSSVLG